MRSSGSTAPKVSTRIEPAIATSTWIRDSQCGQTATIGNPLAIDDICPSPDGGDEAALMIYSIYPQEITHEGV